MRPRWMFATLGVAAVIGGLILAFARNPDLTFDVRTVANTTGGILTLFVAGALIPAIWVFVRRNKSETAGGALALGLFIIGGMTSLNFRGIDMHREVNKSVYAPTGCSHNVTFPEPPRLTELRLANGLKIVQASVKSGESYIRAECIPTSGMVQKTAAEMERQITLYAEQNGLAPYEYRTELRADGIYGFVRGTKIVSGHSVTYSLVLVLSDASFLGLLGGTRSDRFPTHVITDFLESAHLQ